MNPLKLLKSAFVRVDRRAFAGLESLEGRTLLSAGPAIGSISTDADNISRGTNTVISAHDVAASNVARVSFYLDKNANGIIDAGDLFLGYGQKQKDGTTYNLKHLTLKDAVGANTLLARATGKDKSIGDTASTTLTLTDAAPTILRFTASKKIVSKGSPITFVAQATDRDGTIAKVEFYVDNNHDHVAQESEKIGESGPNGKLSTTIPNDITPYTRTFILPGDTGPFIDILAKATDNAGNVSDVKILTLKTVGVIVPATTITTTPTTDQPSLADIHVTPSKTEIAKGDSITLYARTGDFEILLSKVDFYIDNNHDGIPQESEKLGTSGINGQLTTVIPDTITPYSSNNIAPGDTSRFIDILAIPTYPDGSVGKVVSITLKVDALTSLAFVPQAVGDFSPTTFKLTVTHVANPNVTIQHVDFYLDNNNDGIINTGDLLLGNGSPISASLQWSLTLSTDNFTPGSHTFLARATDANGYTTNTAATTFFVGIQTV